MFNKSIQSEPDNNIPSVSNVQITPSSPIDNQDLSLSYNYSDADGDADKSVKEWYRNGTLTGVTGTTFPADSSDAGDKVKAKVTPYDGEDFGTEKESNEVEIDRLNTAPIVSNVDLSPDDATLEDMIQLSYDYTDAESDPDHSTIEWYNNNSLIQTGGMTLASSETNIGDLIKAVVKPYDGELEGTAETSDILTIQALPILTRIISGNIKEYFSQLADAGVQIITSIDTAYTDALGNYNVEASTDEEHVLFLKQGRLESGYILLTGTNNATIDEVLAKDDADGGIGREYFGKYVLNEARRGTIPVGKYVFLTEESVPDTVWILGDIVRDDGVVASVGFQNLEQINKLGEKINTVGDQVTGGLYSINRTTILVADESFANSNFAYSNMKAVPNNQFPINNFERYTKSLFIIASPDLYAFNGTFFENDGVTVKGHILIFQYNLPISWIDSVFDSEFCSSILGGVEIHAGVNIPSIVREGGTTVTQQDQNMFDWVKYRKPGRQFPDFPIGFIQETVDQYKNNF